MERKYGWIKQLDDYRDVSIFSAGKPTSLIIPDEIDLDPNFPELSYDQLQTSSCTGNGGAGMLQYGLKSAGLPAPRPSRLWLYGNARKLENSYGEDAGANIRDIIKGANKYGIIPETDWAFSESKVTAPIPNQLYIEAAQQKIHFYATMDITKVDVLRLCLFHNFPIVFGMPVYEYFESAQMAKNPYLHLPASSESLLGGHCMVIIGADHPNRRFKVRNSWGTSWGQKGNCFIDYDYITQLASDPWMNRFK